MSQGFDSALSQELLRKPFACKISIKKPAASYHVMKKPSSRTAPAKKPASSLKRPSSSSTSPNKPKKMHLKYAGNARIFIADETHLNKKQGALSRSGRPQRDQIWLWGAVLHGHVKTHFFRVLKNAADADDGKPRGHQEMKTNLSMLGMKSGDIFVSDKWKATLSALKAHRELHGLSEKTLRNEIVNHSQGEMVNQNGFSTNAIECKWSLIKLLRDGWIRTRLSGTLPRHNDREKWRLLVDEYQFATEGPLIPHARSWQHDRRFLPRNSQTFPCSVKSRALRFLKPPGEFSARHKPSTAHRTRLENERHASIAMFFA